MPTFDDIPAVMAPMEDARPEVDASTADVRVLSEVRGAGGGRRGARGAGGPDEPIEAEPEVEAETAEPEPELQASAETPTPAAEPPMTPSPGRRRGGALGGGSTRGRAAGQATVETGSPGELPERRVVVIDEHPDIDIEAGREAPVPPPGTEEPETGMADIGATLDVERDRKRRWRMFRKGGDR